MLVLTVREGQTVKIGGDVVLTAVQCDNGKVRIGIEAPKSVPILRETLSEEAVMGIVRKAEGVKSC